uniref:adenylate cyclase n=1 Tax=Xiphophorus couchianus TaxID=32473 RepID=A0A3B5M0S5_9TELE
IETRENLNRLLLENVLPAHVAALFVGENKKNEDLYYKSYDCVCVMFASVPNFKEFYTECDINKEGLECLRLLNEIIADFDELLSKPKFSGVEKIKTIGSTYMATAGLSGRAVSKQSLLFAIAMNGKLDVINRHSFNTFRLRVGINHGPVIAGVIGARKPQYDIWGNTVNVASRMESTGEMGKIQVTEESSQVLRKLGYSCECRGFINVKGKGELKTFFVCTDTSKQLGIGLRLYPQRVPQPHPGFQQNEGRPAWWMSCPRLPGRDSEGKKTLSQIRKCIPPWTGDVPREHQGLLKSLFFF